jgi:mono/diheme cytochrome c family protein
MDGSKTMPSDAAEPFSHKPLRSTATDIGQRLFETKCGICHSNSSLYAGTQMLARRTKGNDKVLALRKEGVPAEYVKHVVRNGLVEMPPLSRNDLTDQELDAVAAYLARAK